MSDLTSKEQEILEREYQEIVEAYRKFRPQGNFDLIDRAYRFACEAHSGVRRKSGEPYIYHPVAVARIVVEEIGLGATSIASSFLHDVVEDTDYTVEYVETHFGSRVANIVLGLTKLSGGVFDHDPESMQSENFRRLLLTMSEDIRVVLVKMADRLHNMRTLEHMPSRKQYKIAAETLYLYAPLAHRLGLFKIKTELENLGFCYEHPQYYKELTEKIKVKTKESTVLLERFCDTVRQRLEPLGITYTIDYREKTPYSVWRKMERRNIPLDQIYDLLAVRIIFELNEEVLKDLKKDEAIVAAERAMCWQIFASLSSVYAPRHGRMRNFLSTPKTNGYEALHQTYLLEGGQAMEVQIRSVRMNEIAEKGCAAHWKYKTDSSDDSELEKWLTTLRELLDTPESNAIEFVDDFKMNVHEHEIFVLTPKGQIKTLPKGCTVLDFAFDIHTDLGMHCLGAKVGHKMVGVNHVIKSGDQVEVLTSPKVQAKQEWMDFVVTGRAKSKLRFVFREYRKEQEQKGEDLLQHYLDKNKLKLTSELLNKLLIHYNLSDKGELLLKLGKGELLTDNFSQIINRKLSNKLVSYWRVRLERYTSSKKKGDGRRAGEIEQESVGEYVSANCCKPLPGDDVVGFDEGGVMYIHKRGCNQLISLAARHGDRVFDATWTKHKMKSFLAVLDMTGEDRMGLVTEVTKIITEEYSVNMSAIHFDSNNGIFKGSLHVYVSDVEYLNRLIGKIMQVYGVREVRRV